MEVDCWNGLTFAVNIDIYSSLVLPTLTLCIERSTILDYLLSNTVNIHREHS